MYDTCKQINSRQESLGMSDTKDVTGKGQNTPLESDGSANDAPRRPNFSTPLTKKTGPQAEGAKPAASEKSQPAPAGAAKGPAKPGPGGGGGGGGNLTPAQRKQQRQQRRAILEGAEEEDTDEAMVQRQANRRRQKAIAAATRPAPAPQGPVRKPASRARLSRRHIFLAGSFFIAVLLPVLVSAWYLYARAADQYASYMGFSVRSESGATSTELLGGLTSLVGGSSSTTTDSDVLYKFIQSHDLVEKVDARLNLREIWSKAPNDPIFGFNGGNALEDLLNEWSSKVRIYYDNGMIDLRILAFNAQDAQAIGQAVLDESTVLINQLNDVAREDGLRYARDELERAGERVKEARQALTEFRNRHQLVDPTADVQGQVGVVSTLQSQLAEQLVQLGLLQANAQPNDPRIEQSELRIQVIREQIAAERQKFGSETGEALSEIVGQYEGLAVDREFAEQSYVAARATYDNARAEAARQSRYLAAYVKPTLAQEPEFPQRGKLLFIIAGFLLVIWIVGILIFYSLRDRR